MQHNAPQPEASPLSRARALHARPRRPKHRRAHARPSPPFVSAAAAAVCSARHDATLARPDLIGHPDRTRARTRSLHQASRRRDAPGPRDLR